MRPSTSTVPRLRPWLHKPHCRFYNSDRTVQVNDVVLLKQKGPKRPMWRLSQPLHEGENGKVRLAYGGRLAMTDIIGKRPMDKLKDNKGREVIIYEPSMANYITHCDKKAVPIYPHDAATIVSMMDINPEHPDETDAGDEPFEVFEAGTGAGSLSLHIARALHAGNPPLSKKLREALATARYDPLEAPKDPKLAPLESVFALEDEVPVAENSTTETSSTEPPSEEPTTSNSTSAETKSITNPSKTLLSLNISSLDLPTHLQSEAEAYIKSHRRTVLHTLDRKGIHSQVAHQTIRRFRRAMYLPTIDFHIGSVAEYLTTRLASRDGRPFLSRAVLDLPDPEGEAGPVIESMRQNAILVVFAPSISQIASFARWSVETGQPLVMDRVSELPSSTTAEHGSGENEGGRTWNVSTKLINGEMKQIMRPRAGDQVVGSGFVGVFRKAGVGGETIGSEAEEVDGEIEAESERESLNEGVQHRVRE